MLNAKRLFGFLEKGVLPEMTALDESLAEHDRRFHPDGYREGDSCNRREGMAKGDRADAGVSAEPKRQDGRGVTEEEDAAYLAAVEKGDLETARRMVREAAAKAMPDTKVVDEDGLPKVVYHGSESAGFTQFKQSDLGIFFSSEDRASWYVKGNEAPKVFHFTKPFSSWDEVRDFAEEHDLEFSMYDPDEYEGENYNFKGEFCENLADATRVAQDFLNKDARGGIIPAFIYLRNPNVIDGTGRWAGNIDQLPEKDDQDGAIVENVDDSTYDEGSDFPDTNYVVMNPWQIKSPDVTWDDDGKVIPLSRRFDFSSDDIRY